MKTFIKKLSIILTFFILGVLTCKKKAYASDYEVDILSENAFTNKTITYTSDYDTDNFPKKTLERVKSEPLIVADSNIVNALKGQIHLDGNTTLFCTSDTPDNVASLLASRSVNYQVVPYSFSRTFNTINYWGNLKKFITIQVSGEVFIYEDGKVHLYTMNVSAIPHKTGWHVSYESNGILNTDGAFSQGLHYVYCRMGSDEHKFGCWLSIYKFDTYPSLSIEQIY